MRRFWVTLLLCFSLAPARADNRFSVADGIGLTVMAEEDEPFHASPDGRRVAFVTRTGDLAHNLNHHRLYLVDLGDAQPGARLLGTWSSSSNRPGVDDLHWDDDGHTLLFAGEQPGEIHQGYSLDTDTGECRLQTHATRPVLRVARSGAVSAWLQTSAAPPLDTPQTREQGLWVGTQQALELSCDPAAADGPRPELWLHSAGKAPRRVPLPDDYALPWGRNPLAWQSDGRALTLQLERLHPPAAWSGYTDPLVVDWMHNGGVRQVMRYQVSSGTWSPLLDAPAYPITRVLSTDRGVMVINGYLPLTAGVEGAAQRRFSFELAASDATPAVINLPGLRPVGWDAARERLLLKPNDPGALQTAVRQGSGWRVEGSAPAWPALRVEQGANAPPKVMRDSSVLLDLNPTLERARLAPVEELSLTLPSGRRLACGLFRPAGKERVPLVIQTHGWVSNAFWPEGLDHCTTAYAAQALASRGIAVVQMDESQPPTGTSNPADFHEGENAVADYVAIIDELDRRGLVNPHKVGLMGWSRTCLHVKWALTHAPERFAAAVVAERVDTSYWQYVLYGTLQGWNRMCERLNGGLPWGPTRAAWQANSPSNLLDRVTAPLLIQVTQRSAILNEWEWLSALRLLHRPVDMVSVVDGVHNLVRPQDRLVSSEASLDWFCFWLLGSQSAEPRKAEQYGRWRALPRPH